MFLPLEEAEAALLLLLLLLLALLLGLLLVLLLGLLLLLLLGAAVGLAVLVGAAAVRTSTTGHFIFWPSILFGGCRGTGVTRKKVNARSVTGQCHQDKQPHYEASIN